MSAFSTCPVCDQRWLEPPVQCECGYHVEQRDPTPAIARLQDRVRIARRRFALGIALLLAVPATGLAVLLLTPSLFLLGLLAIPVEVGFGSVLTITGMVRGEREGKRLDAAKSLMQLPAARLVE